MHGTSKNHTDEQVVFSWKSHLYQVQLKAPKPYKVVCKKPPASKPSYYGSEFHGAIAREEAERLVMEREGSYLTRESQSSPGSFALTFRFNNKPKNYRLFYNVKDKLHYVGEKEFDSVEYLVEDGLITLYVEINAKDYIDRMAIEAKQPVEKVYNEKEDGMIIAKTPESNSQPVQKNSFKASECAKAHNFKTQTYYGLKWCDFCRNFMWGLKAQGVRCQDCLFDCHRQCSAEVGDDCFPDKSLLKRVFGVDLTTFIKAHNMPRPMVVDICINEIEKRGMTTEGLYRVPGYADDISNIQNTIDKEGQVPDISRDSVEDINVVCGLLKLYFRMLPIPLITLDLYDKFIAAVKHDGDRYKDVMSLSNVVKLLPPAHYKTLKHLCRHLQRIMALREKNLMSSENLGIVFGPTLMRAPDDATFEAVANIPHQKRIVQLLIEEQDVLFEA